MNEALIFFCLFLLLFGFAAAFLFMNMRTKKLIRKMEEELLPYAEARGYELQRAEGWGWGGLQGISSPPLLRAPKRGTEVLVDLRHSIRLQKRITAIGEPRWMDEETSLGIIPRTWSAMKGPKPDREMSWEDLRKHFEFKDNTALPEESIRTEDIRDALISALPYGAAFSLQAYNTTSHRPDWKKSHVQWYMSKHCACIAHMRYATDENALDTLIAVVAAVCRNR